MEKNVINRPAADKGKKLVRYFGWGKRQLKPNEFEWNSKGGQSRRAKIGQLAKLGGLRVWDDSAHEVESRLQELCDQSAGKIRPKCFNGSLLRQAFGPRWAYAATNFLREVWGDECEVRQMTLRAVRRRRIDCSPRDGNMSANWWRRSAGSRGWKQTWSSAALSGSAHWRNFRRAITQRRRWPGGTGGRWNKRRLASPSRRIMSAGCKTESSNEAECQP